ncbi:MAG: hypothetical protein HZLCBSQH_001865 [Candidatus Fervidibacterota bacterium]
MSDATRQQLMRILKRLEGRSEATPEESVEQILKLPAKKVIDLLIDALQKSPHYLVRLVACMALGELRAVKAVPTLVAALRDSSLTVQRAAAEALAKIGRPAVGELLQHIDDEDLSMRRWVIHILGKIGAKEAAPALLERFHREAPELQRLIVESLGEIASKKASRLLTELVQHGGADFSRTAIEALGKLKDPKSIPVLLDILARDGAELRKLVREALLTIGKEGMPQLVKALHHPNLAVRQVAAEVLGTMGDRRALRELIKALRDPDPIVRQSAVQAITRFPDKSLFEPLTRLLHDPDQEVRFQALRALVQVGKEMAKPHLKKALKDADWLLR